MSSERKGGFEIAIVAMAGRFPGAADLDGFWRNLRAGVEAVSVFSDEELRAEGVDEATLRDPRYVRAGAMIEGIELFDAPFFGLNPREAEVMDPQHRLFLECSWEVLEAAGYDPARCPGAVGVFAGAGMNGYLLHNLFSNRDLISLVGPRQLRAGNRVDNLAPRVSYKLGLTGPSLTIQTTCSTSLVAVHLACQSLLNGECDLALAGGVSLNVPQKNGSFYQEGGVISPDGHCRAFDARARGTVLGNGLGVVALKRFPDALADGDTVRAVILGSAVNNDGAAKIGYTAPSVSGQAEVVRAALAMAEVEAGTISYVEAHGTGTQLGDPIEVAALTQTFRESTEGRGFCALGSVKTNIGHLDAAAGVAGMIKTVLALEHREIPPSLHFEAPNPEIDFAASPFFVNAALRSWESGGAPRRAGVSSFGIGGTNAHVVLEEAPPAAPPGESRPAHLLLLSARSEGALKQAAENLARSLASPAPPPLADAAFTLAAGRRLFPHRRALVCEGIEEAVRLLAAGDPRQVVARVEKRGDRPVAFLFPGQGAQYPGMARGLYGTERVFREELDRCAEVLMPHLGLDLRTVLFPAGGDPETAARRLRETALAQPALFAVEYALASLCRSWGLAPAAMIGHSIGEYVAACLAGVFGLEEALSLVAARGRLMQDLPPGAMLSVPLPEPEVRPLLHGGLDLAAVNTPDLCVVSGPEEAVDDLARQLAGRGVEARRLHTSHAFHSAAMEPILSAFAARVAEARPRVPENRFVSNLTGTWIQPSEAADPAYWSRHLRQTVRFAEGAALLLAEPDLVFLEVGPGRTLSTLLKGNSGPGLAAVPLLPAARDGAAEGGSDLRHALHALGRLWAAGAGIDWEAFYAGQRRRRVALPTYPFERRRYWVAARPPARQGAAPQPPSAERSADPSTWLHLPVWRRSPPPPPASGQPGAPWLVFPGSAGAELETHLAEGLRRQGRAVVAVEPGALADPEGLRRLLDEVVPGGGALGGVLVSWPSAEAAEGALEGRLETVLRFAQALAAGLSQGITRETTRETTRLILLTQGAVRIAGEAAPGAGAAAALGLWTALPKVAPNLACRCLDVRMPEGERRRQAFLELLLAELALDGPEPVVCYRGEERWVRSFEPADGRSGRAGSLLRPEGAYLVAGLSGGAEELRQALVEQMTRGQARALAVQLEETADFGEQIDHAAEQLGGLDGVVLLAAGAGPREGETESFRALARLGAVARALAGRNLELCLLAAPLAALPGAAGTPGDAALGTFAAALAAAQDGRQGTLWSCALWDGAALTAGEAAEGLALLLERAGSLGGEIVLSPVDPRALGSRRSADTAEAAPPPAGHARPEMETPYVAPATPTQHHVAAVWADLLGLQQVGIYDNFYEIGGHSLLATRIVTRLRGELDAEVSLREMLDRPTVADLSAAIDGRMGEELSERPPLAPVSRDEPLPLSFAQQRLWYVDQLDRGSAAYNLYSGVRIAGALDEAVLRRCLAEIVRRHESLRTRFSMAGGEPVQIAEPEGELPVGVIDLQALPEPLREGEIARIAHEESRYSFDLSALPLCRARLLRLGTDSHVLIFLFHHIVTDGWSMGVLSAEFLALYEAFSHGLPSPLPELPVQYGDFAVWQRRWLAGEVLEQQLRYWRERLGPRLAVLELPTDRPRPAVSSLQGAKLAVAVPPDLTTALKELAARRGASLFMALMAAFKVLLCHLSGQEEIVVGTDVANRNRAETEGLIGFFVNQLVLRTDLSGDPDFETVLARVREVTLGAYAHQDLPFDKVVEALQPERSRNRTPLFQVKFVLQNYPRPRGRFSRLHLSPLEIDNATAKFDLLLNLAETPSGLSGSLAYGTDLFDPPAVTRLWELYQALLTRVAARPGFPLAELRRELAEEERRRWAERRQKLDAARHERFGRIGRRA